MKRNSLKKMKADEIRQMHLLSSKTPFLITEAYKTLRTNLLYSIFSRGLKTVIVTSSNKGEGKSTTCANLALTLAMTKSKVLLIDADMRSPTQYMFFKQNNNHGLSSVLAGFDKFDEAVKKEVAPGLDLLTAGTVPPNPMELLSSPRMKDLLERLKQQYDYVIIDTPPVNVVSDGIVLMTSATGVVLVSRQGVTTYDALRRAHERVEITEGVFLGAIVTFVDPKNKSYGRYARQREYQYE
ncbi:MAG: CpsD/CapB family tyrosine-protein kinase [Oscillospiraceae bacterium]